MGKSNNFPAIPMPLDAVYYYKVLEWKCGVKRFIPAFAKVVVIGETDKSYKIDLMGRETWVSKRKIRFAYLNKEGWCKLRLRYIPFGGCKICQEYCYNSGRDLPIY